MKNRDVVIIVFSIVLGAIGFIWGCLWMMMCLDYKEQVSNLEQEIIQLKWENENNYMYCLNEVD